MVYGKLSGIPFARMDTIVHVVPDSNSILNAEPDDVVANTNLKNAVVLLIKRNKFDMSTGYGIICVVFTLKVYIISYIVTADGKEYAHVSLH